MDRERRSDRVLVAGSANVDYVVRAPRIPAPGETILGGDLTVVPGGKGANQAVACAWAGNVPTQMLAALGDDAGGALLGGSLAAMGVALMRVASDRPTGAALITVSNAGENAITVAPGANMALAAADLPPLDGVAWLVMQLETPIETVTAFARAARKAGTKVMLNVAPARDLPRDLLDHVDVLVANEEELVILIGRDGSIVELLRKLDVPVAIVTLGARGCCAWDGDAYRVQPAFRVDTVDTTAAGDTFCGALAARLADGTDLGDALRAAAAAAALSTTKVGAQASVPTRAEVDRLLSIADDADATAALKTYCGIVP